MPDTDNTGEDPIDSQAVAEILGMHVQEVRRLVRRSLIPAYRLPGTKRYFFFRSEVLAAIRQHPVELDDD